MNDFDQKQFALIDPWHHLNSGRWDFVFAEVVNRYILNHRIISYGVMMIPMMPRMKIVMECPEVVVDVI